MEVCVGCGMWGMKDFVIVRVGAWTWADPPTLHPLKNFEITEDVSLKKFSLAEHSCLIFVHLRQYGEQIHVDIIIRYTSHVLYFGRPRFTRICRTSSSFLEFKCGLLFKNIFKKYSKIVQTLSYLVGCSVFLYFTFLLEFRDWIWKLRNKRILS